MHTISSTVGMQERHLLFYKSSTERLWDVRKDYFPEGKKLDGVETVTHAVGLGMHFFQNTIQSLVEDGVRKVEGRTDPVPPLEGDFARVREDVREGLKNIGKGHIGSAAVKLFNTIGDVIPDSTDFLIGVRHGKGSSSAAA
ncbi:MAG: hypothetical protein WCV62_04255 [Candidatus Peribacteraceae bacterium]|jgi:hypothetical protein